MRYLPVRKPNRLKDYDYSRNGAYFITICTKNHEELFGRIVGANCVRPLSPLSNRPSSNQSNRPSSNQSNRPSSPSIDPRSSISTVCMQLSSIGEIIEDEITILSSTYDNIIIDKYVIMPNHVHMILFIMNCGGTLNCGRIIDGGSGEIIDGASGEIIDGASGRTQFAPTVSRIIKQWKGAITKKIKFSPWQKSFHDRIIRDEEEYYRIAEYIEDNPEKWVDDCYYKKGIM